MHLRAEQAADLRRFDLARELAMQSIAADATDGDGYASLGRACLGSGDLIGAESAFRQALAVDANNAWYLRGLSVCLRNLNRPKDGLLSIEQALQREPFYCGNHYEHGRCLDQLNRFDEAELAFKQAISLDPDSHEPYRIFANFLLSRERLKEAERYYRESLRLHPIDSTSLNNLGVVLERQNRIDEAARCYQQAFDLDPNLEVAKSNTVQSVERILSASPSVLAISMALLGGSIAMVAENWGSPLSYAGAACLVVVAALWATILWKRYNTKNRLGKTDSEVLQTYQRIKKYN